MKMKYSNSRHFFFRVWKNISTAAFHIFSCFRVRNVNIICNFPIVSKNSLLFDRMDCSSGSYRFSTMKKSKKRDHRLKTDLSIVFFSCVNISFLDWFTLSSYLHLIWMVEIWY
jgi:hypothetical protein